MRVKGRDAGLLYVPKGYSGARPLIVQLHGAGSNSRRALGHLRALADEVGVVVLAPDATGRTWDVIAGGYGPDVAAIDALLRRTFASVAVDPERIAVGGFSDGASYALSLGMTNGDLFTHILAFSPGFTDPGALRGKPAVFATHGRHDRVLPIERCSRRIVPRLRRAGHEVVYREFEGGHELPPALAREALAWLSV